MPKNRGGRIGDAPSDPSSRARRRTGTRWAAQAATTGSAGCSPLIASSISARVLDIGAPSGRATPRLRSILKGRAYAPPRPTLRADADDAAEGSRGLRSEPPHVGAVPRARAMPVASATAAPPEEAPRRNREVSHGLRVCAEHFVEGVGAPRRIPACSIWRRSPRRFSSRRSNRNIRNASGSCPCRSANLRRPPRPLDIGSGPLIGTGRPARQGRASRGGLFFHQGFGMGAGARSKAERRQSVGPCRRPSLMRFFQYGRADRAA